MVNLATGEVNSGALRVACKDRRQVVCPACSDVYQTDAWILVAAGLNGGKGVSEEVGRHPRLFVTLTAPSFGAVHTITAHGHCVGARDPEATLSARCAHGVSVVCRRCHAVEDSQLGRPLCDECFDYEGAVLWNAHVSRLWNNTVQILRRSVARSAGVTPLRFANLAQVHYLKVAELQRRGLVHLHVVVRADGPGDVGSEPPEWLTGELLDRAVRGAVKKAVAPRWDGHIIRWGKVLDSQDLGLQNGDVRKVSSYVAKYAVKTTNGSLELARRFRSRRQIEALVDDPHARRLVLAAWDLGRRPEFAELHLREHAHAFGFTGQLITKSRGYSTTFQALRKARSAYMAGRGGSDPLEGSFHYDGRGYDDPRGVELAEVFFAMQRELREEARALRRSRAEEPPEVPL